MKTSVRSFLVFAAMLFCASVFAQTRITTTAQLPAPGLLWANGFVADSMANFDGSPTPMKVAAGTAAVAAGSDFSLIVKTDGSLWAVGDNSFGELGDGTTAKRDAPVQILAGGVLAAAAGGMHSLILKTDGSLWAVGDNSVGQLGDGTTTLQTVPEEILSSGVQAVAAGNDFSLILKKDGSLWAMGNNGYGQLGDGTTTQQHAPKEIMSSGVQAVAAGYDFSLIVKKDGSLWAMGDNFFGQLGDGTTTQQNAPEEILSSGVQAVAAGNDFSLIVKTDGSLWAMGDNYNSELGDGTTTQQNAPEKILSSGVQAVAAGWNHSLILKTDGSLWAVGHNTYGELGDGTMTQRSVPVQILSGGVHAIAAGDCFSLIMETDGSLCVMGDNLNGQLGLGTSPVPQVLMASDVVAAATGNTTSLFVKSDGTLWQQQGARIAAVSGISGAAAVAVGSYDHNPLCLKSDGTLWLLGALNSTPVVAPAQVASGVSWAGAGVNYIVYLKSDGSLWGQGGDGVDIQFGDGTTPVKVADGVASASAAGWHMLFVKSDQTLWGMGSPWGGFGDSYSHGQFVSTPVQLETGIVAAVANIVQNLYLRTDGSLWTRGMGWDSGTGPAAQVDTGVKAMASRGSSTFYVKNDGSAWSRDGVQGTLGTPVQIASGGGEAAFTGTNGVLFLQQAGFGTLPSIATAPQSVAVAVGAAATLQVDVSGMGPIGYQWSKDGTPIAGAVGTQYTVLYLTDADAGNYTVTITNSAGSATSAAATVTKGIPPAFTTQPAGQTVTAGAITSFTVAASGNPIPTYQWQVSTDSGSTWTNLTDTAPYGGTATAKLTITGATGAMNGYQYQCLASNSIQINIASNIAILGVIPAAATPDPGEGVISNGFTAIWNNVSGATGYRLDVSTESSFSSFVSGYNNLDVGNVTSLDLSGLSADTTYYYRIRAYDSSGTGANSSTIIVTTCAPVVVTTPLTVSTLAGQPLSNGDDDGIGSAARFYYPSGIAADNAGNLYLADTDNHTIRKIVASTGAVTTLAGLAGSSGDADGTGSAARFNSPSGLAVDGAGNVYVADTMNNTLRIVTAAGAVSTLAGQAGVSGSTNGTGTAAQFFGPQGLTIDTGSNIYVADTNNHLIRKVVPSTGIVTTVAGLVGDSGSADGLGSLARFNFPSGVAVDGAGNLYVADTDNHTIRVVAPSGLVSTLAGLAGNSGGADGTGSHARFNSPSDLALDSSGNVYVADTDNFTIREVAPSTGAVTTLAGLAETSGSTDGSGSAVRFYHPAGVAVDSSNNLYVADTDNDTVRVGLLAMAPAIQTQPQSQTVTAGSSVQFSVTASGRPAVTYQWYVGGTAINGATGNTYNLSNVHPGDAGNYTVVVSNVAGSVTSNAATLTVNAGTLPPISNSGGGGGAPSVWFWGVLLLLATVRIFQGRMKARGLANLASV
jgi:alpha-tubulin suppressor-like RCC1 family protein/sugar lactone lactonase YvrE